VLVIFALLHFGAFGFSFLGRGEGGNGMKKEEVGELTFKVRFTTTAQKTRFSFFRSNGLEISDSSSLFSLEVST